jgi:SAM-dependent methyltransferase
MARFEDLIAEAHRHPLRGWDFSWLRGRMVEEPLPFDYVEEVRKRMDQVAALLDLGTGGGEVLSRLAPFSARTFATEAYAPNAPIAAARLRPLGASVILVEGAPENYATVEAPEPDTPSLPFRDQTFDLVIDRHESYLAAEVFRLLRPGGRFLTQQCGGTNQAELNDLLGIPRPSYESWSLAGAERQLQAAGFRNITGREEFTNTWFHDVGAIVYFMKALVWQAPDFETEKFLQPLKALHTLIEHNGPLPIRAHHFLVEGMRLA